MENIDNKIILNDDDGNEVEFEFLDLVEYQDEKYVVLILAMKKMTTETL